MTKSFTCRAVSPVLSALVLVVVAVTASVFGYVYSTGVVSRLMGPPPNALDQPSIELIAYSSDGSAQLIVRNVGAGDLAVASIYVDGNLAYSAPQGIWIPIGQAWTFVVSNVFVPGTEPAQHMFKVVTLKGNMVSKYGPQDLAYAPYTVTYGTTYTTTFTGPGLMTTTATTTTTSYIISTGSKTTLTITTTTCRCGDTITTTIITSITTTIGTTTITQTTTYSSTGTSTTTSTGTTTVTTTT